MDVSSAIEWHSLADELDAVAGDSLGAISRVEIADSRVMVKTAMACLVAKSHTDFHAMLLLCRNGFADSGQILARSVVEACVSALYIGEEPEERAERFWRYELKQRTRLGRKPGIGCLSPDHGRNVAEWEGMLGTSEKASWPSMSTMCEALGPDIKSKLHELYYDLWSGNCHALPMALVNRYVCYGDTEIIVHRDHLGTQYLSEIDIPCVFLYAALDSTLDAFRIPPAGELAELGERIRKSALNHDENR